MLMRGEGWKDVDTRCRLVDWSHSSSDHSRFLAMQSWLRIRRRHASWLALCGLQTMENILDLMPSATLGISFLVLMLILGLDCWVVAGLDGGGMV
ncbi:hypothetical protein P152DRAFT_326771 [Eremomyces bilateralis CBS 781.70]|uniref:Uncharacterized protein n=1 Tax=Eremomyces bilateralis CBS 781.70 TaxID=1392243 RepID=A0A6G1G3Y2_9PEZI|nr:uncharacterized protein P152DRAFT_326771 [Eremomyces bilateralis CBS 781.70]KAF1812807.1 hypothetical protein P152DRAFT_326771 [Eremomyces bilateralis CBS 781.70]